MAPGPVYCQAMKEKTITEQESLCLTRNLIRIAIFNITYIRGLFPEKYFADKPIDCIEMKVKKLLPIDYESRRLIDWMEKGVYDALEKKFLKTLLFGICHADDGPLVEEYEFSFSYPKESEGVTMNICKSGGTGKMFKSKNTDLTTEQMKIAACKMVRTLVQLMRTLDNIPAERTIIMKLYYYDEVTPVDYEPPFFRCCTNEESMPWGRTPLKLKVGDVNSKHYTIALKVKSILDPCEDENDETSLQCSLSGMSASSDGTEDSAESIGHEENGNHQHHQRGSTNKPPNLNEDIQPLEGNLAGNADMAVDPDDTEDEESTVENTRKVKQWIFSRESDKVEMSDFLSNFTDISVRNIEAIVKCLIGDGILKFIRKDLYQICIKKKGGDVSNCLTEERPMQEDTPRKVHDEDTRMYMEALYHALPMEHITVAQLQNKLGAGINPATARKLIDKMAQDGYIEESASNRRAGRKVLHTSESQKKYKEVEEVLKSKSQVLQTNCNAYSVRDGHGEIQKNENQERDGSTYGGLHTVGSDLTHNEHSPMEWGSTYKRTPSPATKQDMTKPTASRESMAHAKDINRTLKLSTPGRPEMKSTQDTYHSMDQTRKASMVQEPIHQSAKRIRSS